MPSASVSRFNGAGGCPGRPPRPAQKNLAARRAGPGEGPLERAPRGGGFWRGGHLGWGPPPASTRLHPLAPPGGSGDALNRKKKTVSLAGGQRPSPLAAALQPGKNNCSLLPASCPRSLLPRRPGAQPGRGRRGAGRPPGLPPLAPPLRLDLLRPPRACLRLGPSQAPGPVRGWALSRAVEVSGLPAVQPPSLGLSWDPARACCPFPANFLCSSPSRPSLPSPGVPGLLPALGAGTIAPARARPPGPAAPDARAPRGCWRPGP